MHGKKNSEVPLENELKSGMEKLRMNLTNSFASTPKRKHNLSGDINESGPMFYAV